MSYTEPFSPACLQAPDQPPSVCDVETPGGQSPLAGKNADAWQKPRAGTAARVSVSLLWEHIEDFSSKEQ